jgi:hypothetical protein
MKPLSRQSKWIYGTHDLELGQESYGILKMLQTAKPEVTDQSLDFHHIWLGFSNLVKGLCPVTYIYVGHG